MIMIGLVVYITSVQNLIAKRRVFEGSQQLSYRYCTIPIVRMSSDTYNFEVN